MEEEGEISSPFWLQQSSTNRRRNRHRTSSLFLNSGVLLFTLCLAFSLFVFFFVVPPIISLTPQIFKPKNVVKKSWDSVNVTLVLLALIFGFLSRNRNHDSSFESFGDRIDSKNRNEVTEGANESTPRGWYEYTDRTAVIGLRRNYSSYPNLREISLPEDSNDRWRFYDDTSLESYRWNENIGPKIGSNYEKIAPVCTSESKIIESQRFVPAESDNRKVSQSYEDLKVESQRFVTADSDNMKHNPPYKFLEGESHLFVPTESDNRIGSQAYEGLKVESQRFVPAESGDRKASHSYESILAEEKVTRQVEPPPQQPPPAVRRRKRRQSTGSIENMGNPIKQVSDSEQFSNRKMKRRDEKEEEIVFGLDTNEYYKSERKRGFGSGNAARNFLDSFHKKKKKQRQKSVEDFETLIRPPPQLSPPPPHPFSFKKEKHKQFITVPPPPHIVRAQKSTAASAIATSKPPLPVKTRNFTDEATTSGEDSPLAGAESPIHPIPPPFKIPSWKFAVRGDYVKIRSVSPDPDEVDSPTSTESGETPTAVEAAEVAAGGMFCPSPDVNSKADMFIAKFRAGLKLQKINSMKRKQGLGLSNLGKTTKSRLDSSI